MKIFIVALLTLAGISILAVSDHRKLTIVAEESTSIATNIVTGDNHTGCDTCRGISLHGWAIMHERGLKCWEAWADATERWTITNVVKTITLSFDWNGQHWTGSSNVIISSVTNKETLQWVK